MFAITQGTQSIKGRAPSLLSITQCYRQSYWHRADTPWQLSSVNDVTLAIFARYIFANTAVVSSFVLLYVAVNISRKNSS